LRIVCLRGKHVNKYFVLAQKAFDFLHCKHYASVQEGDYVG
jgi:hypothetical protein